MSYKDPEDAQRPRALYDINPDFRGFLAESFDFKQFKSKFFEIFPQVWSS